MKFVDINFTSTVEAYNQERLPVERYTMWF